MIESKLKAKNANSGQLFRPDWVSSVSSSYVHQQHFRPRSLAFICHLISVQSWTYLTIYRLSPPQTPLLVFSYRLGTWERKNVCVHEPGERNESTPGTLGREKERREEKGHLPPIFSPFLSSPALPLSFLFFHFVRVSSPFPQH